MKTAELFPWWGWIFMGLTVVLLVLIGVMFVSILRQGDERRKLILLHAGSTGFTALTGMLLLKTVLGVAGGMFHGTPMEEQNPLVLLMTAALVYCVLLVYYRKRYGD